MERADLGLMGLSQHPVRHAGYVSHIPATSKCVGAYSGTLHYLGPCEFIPDAYGVYQKGWIKPRTDIQPQGLSQDDLSWIRSTWTLGTHQTVHLICLSSRIMTQPRCPDCILMTSQPPPARLLLARRACRHAGAAGRPGHTPWSGGSASELSDHHRSLPKRRPEHRVWRRSSCRSPCWRLWIQRTT